MHDPIRFILAGNAVFTVENTATGNRFTFKVRRPDDDKPHFVSVLTVTGKLRELVSLKGGEYAAAA